MQYLSTRGEAPALTFDGVVLAGLARDGGLYLPSEWPRLGDQSELARLDYPTLAARVMAPFVAPDLDQATLARLAADAHAGFGHAAVAPLVQIGPNSWLLELFHGPTLAFKDFALQLLGRLFDHVLGRRGERITVIGATSGDTGSAAIEACRDRDNLDIFILFPEGRVSEVQRRQMTTVDAANVHALAVRGSFDDCQALVKAMFNDIPFRDRLALSAVNSINWARVMAQIAYYVWAGSRLGGPDRNVAFSVPTGNFGNVFAGWAARRMGAPVGRLLVASNRNDILTRFFATGEMATGAVHATLSPSMDIQVSSNFERVLHEAVGRDASQVRAAMTDLAATGRFTVTGDVFAALKGVFAASRRDDAETLAEIGRVHAETGLLIDPHTAIGVSAAREAFTDADAPMVCLATAHPAKFPDAVEKATGIRPALPERMADLLTRPERMTVLDNDLKAVQAHILAHATL